MDSAARTEPATPAVVRRANDIARQQAHWSDEEAAEAVLTHLRTFWAPAMRAALASAVDTSAGADLLPVAAAAARQLGA